MPSSQSLHDEWIVSWRSPFQTHHYEPLYLANGGFGGMLDLSGATMDLWSSEIAAVPSAGELHGAPLAPVTALRTQVFFRNAHFRKQGFWIGSTGIHCTDPRYTADPSMPHLPQVYDCHQQLDLRAGIAETTGTLFLGSLASLHSGSRPERAIPFKTRVIFLKDSPVAGFVIEADAEMLFVPEPILHEVFALKGRAKGILRVGNEIDCALELHQTVIAHEAAEGCITYTIQPNGQPPYRVRVSSPGCRVESVAGLPGLLAEGRAFFLVEILPEGRESEAPTDAESFEDEQRRRWAAFWQSSDVCLPASESLWQQRYRASLFYVAQSMGRGAIQPVGLSKPMLPYWFGCFHDTDTYFCRPLLETGHFEEAQRHLDYRHRSLAPARLFAARENRSGALYPWQADSSGRGPSGEIPMNSAIIACEAWHQFRFSGDPAAAAKSAEIVAEIFANLCDLLDFSSEPVAVRPLEMMTFSETMTTKDATEARIAFRAVAAALADLANHHPVASDLIERARRILAELDLPRDADGAYLFCPDGTPEYQRCPSLTLGGFPLHHLPADPALAASLDDELARTVFLFAWLPHQASVVTSQLGRREGPTGAAALLRGADAFYKPWHAYDEWENRRAVRAANFITAAGGFATALHHLLVAETSPGVWSLFPATPSDWRDVSFRDLRLRCGWTVSATLADGLTTRFEARPTHAHAAPDVRFRLPACAPELNLAGLPIIWREPPPPISTSS